MLKNISIYIFGIVAFLAFPWWVSTLYFVMVVFLTRNDLFILLLALANDITFAAVDQVSIHALRNTIFVLLLLSIKFLLQKFTRINFIYDQKK